MRRTVMAWLLGLLGALPLSAQETAIRLAATDGAPPAAVCPLPATVLPPAPAAPAAENALAETPSWQSAWGLLGLRAIPGGTKMAPNAFKYHPNFSLDLDFNFWLWPSQRLYMFADMRLWGETGENGSTNGNDGFVGTSKRQFDLSGGVAWNYYGPWELRAFGFTQNNLNRGIDLRLPTGFTDGFGIENRFYLSPEYTKLGQTGFDVTKATFLSFGYFPSKVMIDNDGHYFKPGMMLRAYLTYDLWDWPCYLFADATYISERSLQARLLIVDAGAAVRPIPSWRQWEVRVGAENTADFQSHNVFSLWYVAIRFIY
jgi:hypothetical protein